MLLHKTIRKLDMYIFTLKNQDRMIKTFLC